MRKSGRERLVIIGNGMATPRLLERLLAEAPDRYAITVFGAEDAGGYNRILLSPVLAGEKSADDIVTHAPEWYAARGIALHRGEAIGVIDRKARLVRSVRGRVVPYDRLVLATGAEPIRLPLPGAALAGVVGFRDFADIAAMDRAAAQGGAAVVIGGGLLGLEAAWGLRRRGMEVTVLHLLPTLMERQLDGEAAALLADDLARRGIAVRTGATSRAILDHGTGAAGGVALEDGTVLQARLVVVAVGIRPRIDLARAAGIVCGRGIRVDDRLVTSDPAILAIGECAEHDGAVFGLLAPVLAMAAAAAGHLAGLPARFVPPQTGTRLKVSGIDMFSAGAFQPGEGDESLTFRDRARGIYRRLVLRDDRLVGALLYGDAADAGYYQGLIDAAAPLGMLREGLIFGPAATVPADAAAAMLEPA
ncbi:MAG: NAD(P)/FAD-dependent oxidoreductase [Rhodospirillales bacterium]|nr:NAD(P)/FAD-dependent oxidoreductase [Rhodospirillales bacterium]